MLKLRLQEMKNHTITYYYNDKIEGESYGWLVA